MISPSPSVPNYVNLTQTPKITRKFAKPVEKPKVRKVQVINRTLSSPVNYNSVRNEKKTKNYVKVENQPNKGFTRKVSTQQYLNYSNFDDIHQIKDKYNTREQTKKIKSPQNKASIKTTSVDDKIKTETSTNPPSQISNKIESGNPVNHQVKNESKNIRRAPSPSPIRRLSEIDQIDDNIKRRRNSKREIQRKPRRNSVKSPLKFDAGAALDRLRGKAKPSPSLELH